MGRDLNIIQIFNNQISSQTQELHTPRTRCRHYSIDFNNYDLVYQILTKHKTKPGATKLQIYDYTIGTKPTGDILKVNDHINRIGENPFIGKQQFFNIDFINVEKIYIQHQDGIITTSCGKDLNPKLHYPSSFLANIATIGHLLNYQIEGFLVYV